MRMPSDNSVRPSGRRLADLRNKAAALERQLLDARASLDHELEQSPRGRPVAPGHSREPAGRPAGHRSYRRDDTDPAEFYLDPELDYVHDGDEENHPARPSEARTEILFARGRGSAYKPGLSQPSKIAIGAALAAALITIAVIVLTGGGASWPSSVAVVQKQAEVACKNPDVTAEPSQIDFACAKATRQILWVFALLTSHDNADFADAKTGRIGLEPITPSQGGEVAWSLNLHHPYSPTSPIDSLQVAARAINNIVGGATLTGTSGKPVVQPGLESQPANCVRYTGSPALKSRKGYPRECAKPVTSAAGQAALVADIYQKWFVGAGPQAAQDAALLFANASNPGDPRVQSILKRLTEPSQPT